MTVTHQTRFKEVAKPVIKAVSAYRNRKLGSANGFSIKNIQLHISEERMDDSPMRSIIYKLVAEVG